MTSTDIKVEQYFRKTFPVQAIRVTQENIEQVAKWCKGEILTDSKQKPHIKVDVLRPLKVSQTMAYIGDWVVYAVAGGSGFKVFTDKAFRDMFEASKDEESHLSPAIVDENAIIEALVKKTLAEFVRSLLELVREHKDSTERM